MTWCRERKGGNGYVVWCRERKGGEGHVVWCRERNVVRGLWCGVERENVVWCRERKGGEEENEGVGY